MTYGDVRGACLALIKSRLGGSAPGGWAQPAALGWKLENGDLSATELSALCGAWIEDGSAAPQISVPRRWRPSPVLRAFLAEYRDVRLAAADDQPTAVRGRATRARRVAPVSDRRAAPCDS